MNASWGMLQTLWNDGIGALFGSNLLLMGGFFLIFGVVIATRLGMGVELVLPFAFGLVFLLSVLNPGMLPLFMWALALIGGAFITFITIKRMFSG